jgi:hypothetical protein
MTCRYARIASNLMRRAAASLLLSFILSGCGAGWHRVDPPAGPISARQQAQVWHDGRFEQWHALLLRQDSISGVPYFRAIKCDSCRLALPRPQVDSLRFGNPTAGFWKTVGLVIGVPALIAGIACGRDGSGCVN